MGHNLHRKGRGEHRARARARTSRTKRDLLKVTFSFTNAKHKKKIINNLQEVDVQHAVL
jgi:hypothetical protein